MVRHDVFCQIEPEFGHLCQNCSFFCHGIFQDNIKAADPVRCYHDQVIAVVVNLTDFSLFDRFHLLYLTLLVWIRYYNRINKFAGIDNSIFQKK